MKYRVVLTSESSSFTTILKKNLSRKEAIALAKEWNKNANGVVALIKDANEVSYYNLRDGAYMKKYIVFMSDHCHSIGHCDMDYEVFAVSEQEALQEANKKYRFYTPYHVKCLGKAKLEEWGGYCED